MSHLRSVFARFVQYDIRINYDKCVFGAASLDFVGHRIDSSGVSPLPERVQAIENFPEPTTVTQLRRFIGVVNYYRRFIPNCASLLQPLTDLLKSKTNSVILSSHAKEAFAQVKLSLSSAVKLHFLDTSPSTKFILTTDASDSAIGAVLQQLVGSDLQPLALFSKKLQPAQTRYSTFDRELLAIYLASVISGIFWKDEILVSTLTINL